MENKILDIKELNRVAVFFEKHKTLLSCSRVLILKTIILNAPSGCNNKEIAEIIGISQKSTWIHLRILEKEGYIKINNKITSKGKQLNIIPLFKLIEDKCK